MCCTGAGTGICLVSARAVALDSVLDGVEPYTMPESSITAKNVANICLIFAGIGISPYG